jgi:two-component system sensor histidine kinase CreC
VIIRKKIFLGYFIIVALGFYFSAKWIRDGVRKSYLEAVEEHLVDSANILASFLEGELEDDSINPSVLRKAFEGVRRRRFSAQIYNMKKNYVDLEVYVVDKDGKVVFDSECGREEGKDYSQWRDVHLTLRGKYGARSSKKDKKDPTSSVLHVAAPIYSGKQIIGCVTVRKPTDYVNQCVFYARLKISIIILSVLIVVMLLGLLLSVWLTRPIKLLTNYARSVRDGKKASPPKLGRRGELAELGKSFEEMREALEGKKYVESYVQSLTHELKSPLSAVKGAVEILSEKNITDVQRKKFLLNIRNETERMRHIVDKMLTLSSLENKNFLESPKQFDLRKLLEELVDNFKSMDLKQEIIFSCNEKNVFMKGDSFLIYEAVDNLLNNALDFSPENGVVEIRLERKASMGIISVLDSGGGIPEYAVEKIFERFYSLPRPSNNMKSSGLGLSIVKEIIMAWLFCATGRMAALRLYWKFLWSTLTDALLHNKPLIYWQKLSFRCSVCLKDKEIL